MFHTMWRFSLRVRLRCEMAEIGQAVSVYQTIRARIIGVKQKRRRPFIFGHGLGHALWPEKAPLETGRDVVLNVPPATVAGPMLSALRVTCGTAPGLGGTLSSASHYFSARRANEESPGSLLPVHRVRLNRSSVNAAEKIRDVGDNVPPNGFALGQAPN